MLSIVNVLQSYVAKLLQGAEGSIDPTSNEFMSKLPFILIHKANVGQEVFV